jgi:hypothetical protein
MGPHQNLSRTPSKTKSNIKVLYILKSEGKIKLSRFLLCLWERFRWAIANIVYIGIIISLSVPNFMLLT